TPVAPQALGWTPSKIDQLYNPKPIQGYLYTSEDTNPISTGDTGSASLLIVPFFPGVYSSGERYFTSDTSQTTAQATTDTPSWWPPDRPLLPYKPRPQLYLFSGSDRSNAEDPLSWVPSKIDQPYKAIQLYLWAWSDQSTVTQEIPQSWTPS